MNTNYSESRFFASVVHFFSGSIISRIFGLIREVLMASIWGSDPLISAFWISFRLVFFLRRILGETTLSMVFIPHFEMLRIENRKLANVFFKNSVRFFTIISCCILVIVELLCWFWLKYLGKDHIIIFIMLLSPSSIFLILHALNVSLLNCEKKFFLTSFSPTIVNIFWLLLLLFSTYFSCYTFLKVLSIFLVIGFLFQWLCTLPNVLLFLNKERSCKEKVDDRNLKQTNCWLILKPMLLVIMGAAASQINSLIDMLIARFINPMGPSFLWYANRIYQLPIGIIVISFFSVLLPSLSSSIRSRNLEVTKDIFTFSFSKVVLLMTIIMLAMILLAFSGINLIYGYGLFSFDAVKSTTLVLWGYALGLVPSAICSIVSVLFYAQKKYFIPTILGILSIILNCFLSFTFIKVFSLDVLGIALATSICSWVQSILLWFFASKDYFFLKGFFGSEILKLRKSLIFSLLAFVLSFVFSKYILNKFLFLFFTTSFLKKAFYFCLESSIFLVFLWLFARIFASEELKSCFSLKFWKTRYFSSDLK